jgi:uncharacterized C2H2 Zn-finger protein
MYPKTKVVGGLHQCPQCEKTFKSRAGFRYHWGKEHTLQKEQVDQIKEVTEKVIKSLPNLKRLTPPKIKKGNLKPETWLLLFSDWHYGQLVKAIEVGGFSEYNPEIAKERLGALATAVVRMLEYHPNKPNELVIAGLGDMVDGSILRGNQQSNIEFGVCRQVIEAVELIADFIIFLSGHFPVIRFYGVYGNHARLTPNPKDAPPQENFDLLLYHFIKQRIGEQKGITIEYTEAQHMIVEVEKHNFWLEHGDTVRGWAGYPYYGADREKNNIMSILAMFKEQAQYLLMGHHHRLSYFNNIIGNGSFVGGDLFSIGRLRRMGIAEQALLSVNEKHGVVWVRPLKLSEPKDVKLKIYK